MTVCIVRSEQNLVLPPSLDQLRGVVDHSLIMFQESFRIPADEIKLMLGALPIHRSKILYGMRFRQLREKFVEDLRLRDCPVEKFSSGKQRLVQQHVSRAGQKRKRISVRFGDCESASVASCSLVATPCSDSSVIATSSVLDRNMSRHNRGPPL